MGGSLETGKNPKPLREYYVYILTNETHRLSRPGEGCINTRSGFASRCFGEKQIKGWKRYKKSEAMATKNPKPLLLHMSAEEPTDPSHCANGHRPETHSTELYIESEKEPSQGE